nr:porin [uncultured Cohaesibacter sp.]
MNIKSLILGSAAVLVAGGAAQAADLPVAEPVDYVKVCDAYGTGYFFIPGTDTCLKLSGYVRTEAQFNDANSRDDSKFVLWARGQVNFDAKEETELGTLSSRVRIEGDSSNGKKFDGKALEDGNMDLAKAWLSLGGFYMGLISDGTNVDYNAGDIFGGDFDKGDITLVQVGYNLALGNGVTATVAALNDVTKDAAYAAPAYAGQTMPALSASLKISQAWGEVATSATVHRLNYVTNGIDDDYGYIIAAGGQFNLDMLSAGSMLAFNSFYTKGALGWTGVSSSLMGDVALKTVGTTNYALNEAYGFSAGLRYAFADNIWAAVTGGYAHFNDKGYADHDYDLMKAAFEVEYKPVKNLAVKAGIEYRDVDYDKWASDDDYVVGAIRLQRNF